MKDARYYKWDESKNGQYSVEAFYRLLRENGFIPSIEVTMQPGEIHPSHSHDYDELVGVKNGCVDVQIHGERYRIKPGQALFIGKYERHTVFATGNHSIDIFGAVPES